MQSGTGYKMCTVHAKFCRFFIHLCHKVFLRAKQMLSQPHTALRAGRKHHTIKDIDCLYLISSSEACQRSSFGIQPVISIPVDRDRLILIRQIFQTDNCCHNLRHGCRINLCICIFFCHHFAVRKSYQNPGPTVDIADVDRWYRLWRRCRFGRRRLSGLRRRYGFNLISLCF